MNLQIVVELPSDPQPTYHLTVGEITAHYRDVMSVLDAHGMSHEQASAALGLSPTTLTAYGRAYGTAAHRTIPAATLDRLRDLAVDAFWRVAADPYRADVAGSDPIYFVPIWHAVDDWGLLKARHPHPLRALEVADKCGGWVRVGWSADPLTERLPPIDEHASLRSRWRKSARRIYRTFGAGDVEGAADLLCAIADCCRNSLWQYSTEYRPWRIQVSPSQVLQIEAACRDLEIGDEIQPFESEVRRAMADLEDL
ncbi:hypothetical protein E0H68_06320 [Rhizobium leguminosarum bv. viciae]|uniref:hypothetical protein n=1 Tax=Rhizobium leguminosarum TaxID=384 RepID=UPI0010391962|nr:hypothetical protein [Rhizobium leguminosarum]TCA17386.1 hypothetical protein E0H68_06320 [Rhizobium leguminosarum bv. viciae]